MVSTPLCYSICTHFQQNTPKKSLKIESAKLYKIFEIHTYEINKIKEKYKMLLRFEMR